MKLDFKTLQNDFNSRTKNIKNKKLYIQNELKQIEVFLNHEDYNIPSNSPSGIIKNNYIPKIETLKELYSFVRYGWYSFNKAFKEYYYNEEDIEFIPSEKGKNITQTECDSLNEKSKQYHMQGQEFAKYVLWLKNCENLKAIKSNKQNEIPHKQKMLVLYYLGLETNKYDKVNLGKLLSSVLELSYDNTRKYLSYVSNGKNEVRTIKNLSAVKNLFETYGLTEISNQIQKDIDTIT
jgi:hypothetical protein